MSTRNQLIHWIERGLILPEQVPAAMETARLRPDGNAWQRFIDYLLLAVGALSLAAGLVFFIAYNWTAIGRFAKFGLVEAVIALAVLAFLRPDINRTASKFALLVAAIALGVLLALFGQTYQTGADPWELFFNWALLILPWVVIARFAALWLLWLALLNLALVLYYTALGRLWWWSIDNQSTLLWLLFGFNLLAHIGWEVGATRWKWLNARWAVRVIATAAGSLITFMAVLAVVEESRHGATDILVWLLWLGGLFVLSLLRIRDLFMLAGGCLSAITVITTFLGYHLLDKGDPGAFLLLALLVIGMGSGAAIWLRKQQREWTND
jgi:uncharacterized membrane protein